jgi:hypothetical protein
MLYIGVGIVGGGVELRSVPLVACSGVEGRMGSKIGIVGGGGERRMVPLVACSGVDGRVDSVGMEMG